MKSPGSSRAEKSRKKIMESNDESWKKKTRKKGEKGEKVELKVLIFKRG